MKSKRSGFSLVLSLTVMSGMVLMVIVLASFLQIESRLAQSQAGHQRARLNALAAARVAIGQLQFMMGPDQRVSMRADMYVDDHTPPTAFNHASVGRTGVTADKIPNPNAPLGNVSHSKRHWTGVWATGGVNSTRVRDWNVASPHDTRLFLGWLVSPARASSTFPDEIDDTDASLAAGAPANISIQNYAPNRSYFPAPTGAANMTEGQALINGLSSPFVSSSGTPFSSADQMVAAVVPLVSRGTVSWPNMFNGDRLWQQYFGAVDAIPLPLPGAYRDAASRTTSAPNGRFAFWIGDEGIKAKVNLPDAFAHTPAGAPMSGLTEWERALTASAAQRSAMELAPPVTSSPTAADNRISHPQGVPASFATDFRNWRNADIQSAPNPASLQLARAYTPAEVALWAQLQSGGSPAAAETMRSTLRALWPDVTTYSFSTLTDVYSGGPKTDLSTAFELPYSVFRTLEVYPGQKATTTPVAQRAQTFFHGAQGPTDLDFNRPNLVDKLGSPSQLLTASPRASEWAARYVGPTAFSSLLTQIRNRNGGETPERLGFAYEVPLSPAFFNSNRLESTRVSATGTPQYDALPWRGLLPDDPDNLMGRIIRGPTWDLYRNFYRTYKREMETAAAGGGLRGIGPMTDATSFAARGVEPLTYATGNRMQPTRREDRTQGDAYNSADVRSWFPDGFYSDGSKVDENRYFHRNNLANSNVQPLFQAERRRQIPYTDAQATSGATYTTGATFTASAGIHVPRVRSPNNGSVQLVADNIGNLPTSQLGIPTALDQTTRTVPTSPSFMPSVLRFSTVYSAVRTGSLLGITVDPIIVLHNPYDAPMEFQGVAMVSNASSNPFRFIFRLDYGSYYSTERMYQYWTSMMQRTAGVTWDKIEDQVIANPWNGRHALYTGNWNDRKSLSPSSPADLGDVVIGGGDVDNRSFVFRVVAGANGTASGGRTIKLNPGEVRVISTAPSTNDLDNSGGKNVSVPGDSGFELQSRVFYKMTPYHNARARLGTRERDSFSERVLWNLDFDDCRSFANYVPALPAPQVPITWNNGGLSDPTYAERLQQLLHDSANARKMRDAMTFTSHPFNPDDENAGWDGTIASLENKLGRRTLRVLVRNTGWLPYHGRVIGTEGETIVVDRKTVISAGIRKGEPALTETPTQLVNYVAPAYRTGRTGTHGNQTWNFYLIGKQAVDGRQLNTHRRWFGTPDDNPASYVPDSFGSSRFIRKYREGSETVNGFNLVDEDLLLNFQAMCSGWPMYSNSNSDDVYYVQVDREWLEAYTGPGSQPDPNYYIRGSWNTYASTVPTDPEYNNLTGKPIELTQEKANTLNKSEPMSLPYGTQKAPVFMVDFVRRAADSTRDTARWYPSNVNSSDFGNSGASNAQDRMRTPGEIRQAPTTPFTVGHRAQQAQLFGYDGKAHAPLGWIQSQRTLDGTLSRAQFPTSSNFMNAYWGRSVTDAMNGQEAVILFPVPRRPLLSLSQLGTTPTAEVSTDADLTVGASFAHPGIGDLTKVIDWPGPRDVFPTENSPEFSALHGSSTGEARGPVPELGYVAKAMGTRPVRNRTAPRVDHAFASNLALWDGFYFSGLNLPASSYSPSDAPNGWPSGPDLATDPAVRALQETALTASGMTAATFTALKTALEAGSNPLANKRMAFIPDGRPAANLVTSLVDPALALTETDFPHPKYLARNSLYNGGFNVNSTSKSAWKAVLGALRGTPLPDLASGTGTTSALTKFSRAIGGTGTDGSEPWTKHRELTDAQVDELAERVVAEVRGRGPFMSLADFINRRLVNSEIHGLKGALQAAIDKTGADSDASRRINSNAITAAGGTFDAPDAPVPGSNWYDPNDIKSNNATSGSFWVERTGYPKFEPKLRFPGIRSMSANNPSNPISPPKSAVTSALGAAGLVTQMDVLNAIGPNLTARSDTFVIRAYGEALDSGGRVIGKAWIEVVVQRGMQYVIPGANGANGDDPNRRRLDYRSTAVIGGTNERYVNGQPLVESFERNPLGTGGNADQANVNRIFGRRFRATSMRWLGPNEI
ncbi:MAG: hypothetical protein ACKO4N_08275 [Verrucomicrobiota bacterium]